jgi:hypothetical protein
MTSWESQEILLKVPLKTMVESMGGVVKITEELMSKMLEEFMSINLHGWN